MLPVPSVLLVAGLWQAAAFGPISGSSRWPGLQSSTSRHPRRAARLTALRMAADLYETLGVSRGASESEIKSSYRKVGRAAVLAFEVFTTGELSNAPSLAAEMLQKVRAVA